MAFWGNNVKVALLKGLDALGKSASTLSSAAQQKLSEMNLVTRRAELMKEIPAVAMKLWQNGEVFPEELSGLLSEWYELNQQLKPAEPKAEEKAEEAVEPDAEPSVETQETPDEQTEISFEDENGEGDNA